MSSPRTEAGPGPVHVEARRAVRFGVLGAGRIGRLHAELLRSVPGADVRAVADARPEAARRAAADHGLTAMGVEELLSSPDLDAVAICTSTDTHAALVVRAAATGKAIMCEKPVSLDLAEVDRALDAVAAAGVTFMVGFNRRFDPGHASVAQAVRDRAIGDLHVLRITSRDPAPPSPEYVAVSGGIFLDMTIHDLDLARFVAGSDVVEVYARGAVRVDPRIGEAGDVDTAVVVLTHADGVLTVIDNSREAVYGFDQRVEAFGSRGLAMSDNPVRHSGWIRTADATRGRPLPNSFLERYREAFRLEWEAFVRCVRDGTPSPVGAADARAAVVVALAAARSLREGRPVRVGEADRGQVER